MSGPNIDEHMRLVGDEDCGVGINCLLCDSGGEPVAYYAGVSPAYEDSGVHVVRTISGLLFAAQYHLVRHHDIPWVASGEPCEQCGGAPND